MKSNNYATTIVALYDIYIYIYMYSNYHLSKKKKKKRQERYNESYFYNTKINKILKNLLHNLKLV